MPFDMDQFRMLFSTCKVPGINKDTIRNYFKTGVCVFVQYWPALLFVIYAQNIHAIIKASINYINIYLLHNGEVEEKHLNLRHCSILRIEFESYKLLKFQVKLAWAINECNSSTQAKYVEISLLLSYLPTVPVRKHEKVRKV